MATHDGIFPTFFLSGFEWSTFDWGDQGRRNLVEETRHADHVDEDYAMFRGLGIAVAREGIPWPLVERDGDYGFSSLEPFIAAKNRHQILPIWDLCHYGYPDDAGPFAPDFVDEAEQETLEDTFYAWDVIAGNCHPELGGAPEILDIVGVNCYSFGQMEFREQGPHAALSPDDSRIKPLGGC